MDSTSVKVQKLSDLNNSWTEKARGTYGMVIRRVEHLPKKKNPEVLFLVSGYPPLVGLVRYNGCRVFSFVLFLFSLFSFDLFFLGLVFHRSGVAKSVAYGYRYQVILATSKSLQYISLLWYEDSIPVRCKSCGDKP